MKYEIEKLHGEPAGDCTEVNDAAQDEPECGDLPHPGRGGRAVPGGLPTSPLQANHVSHPLLTPILPTV